MGIVAEFARFGATLTNYQWAVSAEVGDEIVMSLWRHKITAKKPNWIYRDRLPRWSGNGNALLAKHLQSAWKEGRRIRMVRATTDNPALVDSGADASEARNTFKAIPEWVGRVSAFDGDNFTIVFHKHDLPDG